jgi:hypothetical protein
MVERSTRSLLGQAERQLADGREVRGVFGGAILQELAARLARRGLKLEHDTLESGEQVLHSRPLAVEQGIAREVRSMVLLLTEVAEGLESGKLGRYGAAANIAIARGDLAVRIRELVAE